MDFLELQKSPTEHAVAANKASDDLWRSTAPELYAAIDLLNGARAAEQRTLEDDAKRDAITAEIEEVLFAIPQIAESVHLICRDGEKKAARTRKTYRNHFGRFCQWAAKEYGLRSPFPPQLVAMYLLERHSAGIGINGVQAIKAAIDFCHPPINHGPTLGYAAPGADPLIKAVIREIRLRSARPAAAPPSDSTPAAQEG